MSTIDRSANAVFAAMLKLPESESFPGVRFFTIGELAEASGYSVPCVRERVAYWVSHGYIDVVYQAKNIALYAVSITEE